MKKAKKRKRSERQTVESKQIAAAPGGSQSLREKLVSEVRYGKTTPAQAEAKAKEAGLPPFASEPAETEFDPMRESHWTMGMVLAWIAWRDLKLVREQIAEFRAHTWHWVGRTWSEPAQDGLSSKQTGWELEQLHRTSSVRLGTDDRFMRANDLLPYSAQLTPKQAEQILWQRLGEGRLAAEGFNETGKLVAIPAGEWAHLKLYEENERDVLRYDVLSQSEPYSKVRFDRKDVLALWRLPSYQTSNVDELQLGTISANDFAPVLSEVTSRSQPQSVGS